ncbi:MAG: hypothetical protein JXA16_11750, partial [Bacteroidales bacterium]|nr:hypothetical protein [Bacteroidales bacterium]
MNKYYTDISIKINKFLKRYYLRRLFQGIIIGFLLSILSIIALLTLEYFLYMGIQLKHYLIKVLIGFNILNFIYFILLPLLQVFGFIRTLKRKDINEYIVNEFPDIKDKLINVFELKESKDNHIYSNELISKSIEQKINELKPYNFKEAIKFRIIKRYLLYAFSLFLILSFSYFLIPDFYRDSSFRIIEINQEFEKPLPFDVSILNDSLCVGNNEDFILKVHLTTKEEINDFLISFWGNKYKLKHDSANYYSYKFVNINNDLNFNFLFNNYKTQEYKVKILKKPFLQKFYINVEKPKYTKLENEKYENLTQLLVPGGSFVQFRFNAIYTDEIHFFDGQKIEEIKNDDGKFIFKRRFINDTEYNISLKNENFLIENYLKGKITIINDEYPTIKVYSVVDSIDYTKIYYRGIISDDYGFSGLKFVISSINNNDSIIDLNYLQNNNEQEFYFSYDFSKFKGISKRIDYYFKVYDNDEINDKKSAISELFTFIFPDDEDINKFQNEKYDEIEDVLINSKDLTDKLKNQIEDFQEKLIN